MNASSASPLGCVDIPDVFERISRPHLSSLLEGSQEPPVDSNIQPSFSAPVLNPFVSDIPDRPHTCWIDRDVAHGELLEVA